ncbi:MAG: DJ-1/PfpI family protein [Bacillota bacterium]|nr:DJ-1/PfpI family protein [Bacillota bacterium]
MKTFVLVYEGYVQFEIVLACYLMKTKSRIITVGLDSAPVNSYEGFKVLPQISLAELDTEKADIFIMPGGNPEPLLGCSRLKDTVSRMNSGGTILAAICSAPLILARAGVLSGKKFTTSLPVDEFTSFSKGIYTGQDVEIDGNILTAKANAYVDFAIEAGKMLGIFRDNQDLNETIQYFKYFKDVFR